MALKGASHCFVLQKEWLKNGGHFPTHISSYHDNNLQRFLVQELNDSYSNTNSYLLAILSLKISPHMLTTHIHRQQGLLCGVSPHTTLGRGYVEMLH